MEVIRGRKAKTGRGMRCLSVLLGSSGVYGGRGTAFIPLELYQPRAQFILLWDGVGVMIQTG